MRHQQNPDYLVLHGALQVGRICKREVSLGLEAQWLWAINGSMDASREKHRSVTAETLEQAKADLTENWNRCLRWAKLAEMNAPPQTGEDAVSSHRPGAPREGP